jgi:Leishmanolysin
VNRFRKIAFLFFMLTALIGCGGGAGNTPTFSFGDTTITVGQGAFNNVPIRTAFNPGANDTVTLSLESSTPGITGTFNPPTVNATSPDSVLSVNVAGSVSPGGYELTVKGTSGARVNTAKVQLTVNTFGGGGGDTLSLEASGGPLNLGGSKPPSTLVIYRLLLNGTPPDSNFNITLTGPAGWNGDKTVTGQVSGANPTNFLFLPVTVVSGAYNLAAEVAGEPVSVNFSIDATPKLPQVQGIKITGATANSLTSQWSAVAGASSYLAGLNKAADDSGVGGSLVAGTTATIQGALQANTEYYLQLFSFSTDLTNTSAPLPAQINASLTLTDNFVIEGGGGGGNFSISLRVNGTLTDSQRKAFEDAAARWATIITGSTGRDENVSIPEGECGDFPAYEGEINNVLIDLRLKDIDGPGKILGQAGPCIIRTSNGLTSYGIMEFDTADVEALEAKGGFSLVVLHEMGHVLGFGSLWEDDGRDVLDEPCRSNEGAAPGFKGPGAVAQFGVLGGNGNPPIENNYGPGTRCSHWDEGFFDNELMTGFLGSSSGNPVSFSALTIASMADLGYQVNSGAAEAYSVPGCSPSCDDPPLRAAAIEEPWEIILEPKGTIDSKGNIQFFKNDR